MEARASFAPELKSASDARHFAERTLAEWDLPQVLEATRLLVSELVVNAVIHARTDSELVLRAEDGRLRVEVTDHSAAEPVLQEYSPTAPSGRGLLILDELADEWGVERDGTSKVVWFDLALDGEAEPAGERPGPHPSVDG